MMFRNLPKPSLIRSSTGLLAIGLGLSVAISSCTPSSSTNQLTSNLPNSSPASSTNAGQNNEGQLVRIGYQKFGTLNILKARGNLDQQLKNQGISVQWIQFPAGPQLLEALNTGSIDFGHTGEAPPVFAQAANAPLLYIASQTPNPKAEAILVRKDSPLQSVADLKGKTIALNKGSNVHFLLVKALEDAGVKYEDVVLKYLPPADARAAFEQGRVDAWVIWDPFFSAAKRATEARVLRDGEGLVANREFYLAAKPFNDKYPERIKTVLEEVKKADVWAKENVTDAAKLLSPELGIDVATLEEVLQRRPSGVQSISPDIVKYQQDIADTFLKLKLLPKAIDVKEVAQTTP